MQRINQRTAAQVKRLKDKRAISLILITNAVALAYGQAQDGGYVHWEWPRDAASHGLSVVMRMVEDLCLITVRLDGCQVGLRDDKGVLCYKPWIIYTNCSEMAKALALKCSRDHVHAHIEGKLTAKTAYYPKPMCNRVVLRMLGRDPSQKPTSWEVNNEVYAASWEKLLGTIPPPQMTEQEADEALEKMGKDKKDKLQTHA